LQKVIPPSTASDIDLTPVKKELPEEVKIDFNKLIDKSEG
jgi:hypothetical protein